MNKNITIEPLDVNNWYTVCSLSVTEEQKQIFPVANVYWIGISRYEEGTELFAIKQNDDYAGLIGCGYDEDGVSGFINPLMVDKNYQRQGVAEAAMKLIIKYLSDNYKVDIINTGFRKNNIASGNLYKKLGFTIIGEDEKDYFCSLKLNKTHILPVTISDIPFLTCLMNYKQIQAAIHIGDTDIACWQKAFNAWAADTDEENYIIWQDDKPAGWMKLNGFNNTDIAWISMLVIAPEYQKTGLGSYAVNFACELIKNRGFKSVGIHTNKENTAAHRCYEKCGFTVTEIGDCTNSDGVRRIGYSYVKTFDTDDLDAIKSHWSANLYDRQETQTDDVQMLLSFLGTEPKKVFEACCGSGRILVPLANARHFAVGVDIDIEMMSNLAHKVQNIDNLRLFKGDAVTADWGHDFDVCVLGGNILINIVSNMEYREAQRLFIKKSADCLKEGGYIYLDFNLFMHPEVFFGGDRERVIFEGTDDRGVYGKYIVFGGTYDSNTQISDSKNRTELTFPDGTQKIIYVTSRKYIPTLADVHSWLAESGYVIMAEYGNYNKNPISDNTYRAIIWAKKVTV